MQKLIEKISSCDRAVGYAAAQIQESAESEKWFPALAALFLLTEQTMRWATDSNERANLSDILTLALQTRLVTKGEAATLEQMRYFRNKYIHADFHSHVFEIKGLAYSISDAETAEVLFGILNVRCMRIIYKLLKTKPETLVK